MMWEVVLYETERGVSPVSRFIESLQVPMRAKLARDLDLLNEFGLTLGQPYIKKLSGISEDIWELRTRRASDQVRLLFSVLDDNTIVLLHGFVKKTQRIPRREIETAAQRIQRFVERKK